MKTIAIKMKSYATGASVANNNDMQRKILNILLGSLAVFALCYIFLLGSMVFNIVERRSLEADARTLSNEVGDLELQYLSISDKVDLSLAQSMGFKETRPKFATRKALGSIKLVKNEL